MFYKVTSSAIMFDVKGPGNAVIGLAKKPKSNCDYWIVLGENHKTWIKKTNDHSKTVSTPNIITLEEYRSFWISWNNGHIKVGRDGETKPIITSTHNEPNLYYVTFGVFRGRNIVHWRFHLPPFLEKPKLKLLNCGEPYWVSYENRLPKGALIGGYENENVYVIRASHRGSLTPGKFVPSQSIAYISWGGEANPKTQFEVLCGFDCIWVSTSDNRIPVGAIEAGHSEDHLERLYVGRAMYDGHLIPGKVQPSHSVCYIPYGDREISRKKYEILVRPNNNRHCDHRNFINDIHVDSASDSDDDDLPHHFGWRNNEPNGFLEVVDRDDFSDDDNNSDSD